MPSTRRESRLATANEHGARLELLGLSKSFGDAVAVDGVNLAVEPKQFLTVLGPSGCGKTTLLRLVGGFLAADTGQILIDGADVSGLSPERRPTAMLFQGHALWPHLTVARNVSFGLEIRKINKVEIARRVGELLELVGLTGLGSRLPGALSGGQQQRVALARALALEPRLLLLDEPFSSLDLKLRLELRTAVRSVQREVGTTTILVTHDQDEALELSDSIVVMSSGRIEQVGTPGEIYEQPRTRFVAEFIGTMNFLEVTTTTDGVELDDHVVIPLEERADLLGAGRRVTVGIRPEDVLLGSPGVASATALVSSVTLRGHYRELVLVLGRQTLRAYVARSVDLETGAVVGLSLRALHLFDEAGSRSAAPAAPAESRLLEVEPR